MTTRVSVGKTAVTGCPLCFSQDVSALRLHDSKLASPEFLALYLRFQRERIVSRNQGSTISGITRNWQGGSNSWMHLQRSPALAGTNANWVNTWTSAPPTPISGSYTDFFGTNLMEFYRMKIVCP